MAGKKKVLLSTMDVGGWAEHYASRPYGHFKKEVYNLFIDILGCLPPKARVLDIGAGPGHLAFEFYKRNPKSGTNFTLLDTSAKLLEIAMRRIKEVKKQVKTFCRSYNSAAWARGLGKFDALVSNNSLFHVRPRKLGAFYRSCFSRLKHDGILLNQQSFAYHGTDAPHADGPFENFMRSLPETIMPPHPCLTKAEKRKLETEKRAAARKSDTAIIKAKESGVRFAQKQTGYNFLTVGRHLENMRHAGFEAGCIWRKREFAVVLGVKGNPGIG